MQTIILILIILIAVLLAIRYCLKLIQSPSGCGHCKHKNGCCHSSATQHSDCHKKGN